VDPTEAFRLAWQLYYDFPYTQADRLDHLSQDEIDRLTSLRRHKLQGAAAG